MKNALLLSAVFSAVVSIATPCHAITIVLQEAAVGSTIPGQGVTTVAANTAAMFPSNGDFRNVIRQAANYWQTIYTLPYTITITWGFANLASPRLAQATGTQLQQGGAGAGLIQAGSLAIDTDSNGNNWYIDGNTGTFAEFGAVTSEQIPYFNRPGAAVEIGRWTATTTTGNAARKDLYTTVLHEIGHLLGMSSSTPRYTNEVTDGDIDVVTWHVNPGLSWMSSGAHLTAAGNPRALMAPSLGNGTRRWPSQADISCNSQVFGWWTTSWGTGGGGVTGLAANNPVNQ